MSDPIQAFLQASGLLAESFAPNSRYAGVATARMTRPDGRPLVYLRRRFVPELPESADSQEHLIREGDRLDNLAARYLGDPEVYWLICDANRALRPDELVEIVGRRIRIAPPQL